MVIVSIPIRCFFVAACCAAVRVITQSNGAESIIVSAGSTQAIMLSAHAESMMLSACAESMIVSALPTETMILSALPADATHKHTGKVRQLCVVT
jgi:hypothetical protein